MKKIVKWIFTSVISLSLILTFAWFFRAEAENAPTSDLKVNGAAIRTDEKAGIQFEAQSTYTPAEGTEIQSYGIVVMLGEQNVDDVNVDAEGAYEVLVSETDGGLYYLTIFKFPEDAYINKITARAFVVLDDSSIVYADTVTVRSLADVALDAKNVGTEGTFIQVVTEYVGENYMNVWTDSQNNIHVSNAVYETNPTKLEVTFLNDWNTKFGTEFTTYSYSDWSASAKEGYGEGTGLTANGDTNCSGTNAYEFFITDPETSARWKWLLTYFLEKTNTQTHPKRQINALLNGGSYSDSYGGGLQQFAHLARSLQNFFDATGEDVFDSGIDIIITNFALYDAIATYNTTVYSTSPELVLIGDSITLETLEKTGYSFEGYTDGTTTYLTEISITADSSFYTPVYSPVEYNVSFYDGETELTDLAVIYTVAESVTLPTAVEKEGYKFAGWYENAEFTGNAVTEIAVGSTGPKVYYAKFIEGFAVTYVTNGGTTQYSSFAEMSADFVADFNATTGKSVAASGLYGAGNVYHTFFDDEKMFAKWSWTLQLFIELSGYMDSAEAVTQLETFLAGEGSTVSVQYAVRQNIQGLMTLSKCTNYSKFAAIDFSLVEVQLLVFGAINGGQEKEIYTETSDVIADVYRTGYTFAGWYLTSDFSGDPVTSVSETTTLYAKWIENTYTVTYVLGNEEATMESTELTVSSLAEYELVTPTYDDTVWKFNGWYSNEECTESIETVAVFNTSDIVVYGSWTELSNYFEVTYSLDGGNLSYSTYDELIADYTADYTTLTGQTSFSVWKGTASELGNMFRNSDEWDWLLDYWAAVNTNSYNGTTNASVFMTMKTDETCSDYYFFSTEMTAFATSTQQSVYSGSLISADYSDEAVRNEAWTYLSASQESTIGCTEEYVLPTAVYKVGYTFGGWYTTSTFEEGTEVTSVSSTTTVYAKWVAATE